MTTPNLLEVRQLSIRFRTDEGLVDAVKNVSFSLKEGASLAIVGESGSGKSVTALSLTRLLPEPPAEIVHGDIVFRGEHVLRMDLQRLRAIRGGGIAYIFQEPSTSLNPVYTIRSQIAEAIQLHRPESEGCGCRDRSMPDRRRHREPGTAHARLPASAKRRHAAARDDRDGTELPARSSRCRRADHRSRRDDPGANLERVETPARRVRHGAHPHHAQHRDYHAAFAIGSP